MTSEWLKPAEVAAQLRVSVGTLANWRWQRIGPRFTKLPPGGRVRYRQTDIDAYLDQAEGQVAA